MKNGLFITVSGDKEWWLNDKLHREDGPAVEYTDGSTGWYLNDKLHREDGPAVEWWLNDKHVGNERPKNWEELVQLAQVEMIMEI
jgi:hypothetical protein